MTDTKSVSQPAEAPKKKKLGTTSWILISLVAGIVVGIGASFVVTDGDWIDLYVIEGVFYVLGQAFIRLMQMIVVPLVFCSIVCGAASMSDPKMLGRVGGGAILMYLATTALAIIIAIGLATVTQPGIGLDMASITKVEPSTTAESTSAADTLLAIIPTNIFSAMADGTMLQIIFFALVLGFLLGHLGKKVATVNRFFTQFNGIMMQLIGWILKLAPIGILPMIKFIGTVYLGLAVQLFVVYMLLLVLFTRLNPIHFLKKYWPVTVFGFSTSSSNATIPLNMRTLENRIGVDNRIASFTIPLGATINMDGTAIMQGAAVIFVAQAYGIDLGMAGIATVVATAVAASIGTAGVPGVGTIMLTMVFSAVGLPAEGVAMIMGIDRILDMGRTAVNVTGDGVVTTSIAAINGMLDKSVFNDDSVAPIDADSLIGASDEPEELKDFVDPGKDYEVGESGEQDKFANMEDPDLVSHK